MQPYCLTTIKNQKMFVNGSSYHFVNPYFTIDQNCTPCSDNFPSSYIMIFDFGGIEFDKNRLLHNMHIYYKMLAKSVYGLDVYFIDKCTNTYKRFLIEFKYNLSLDLMIALEPIMDDMVNAIQFNIKILKYTSFPNGLCESILNYIKKYSFIEDKFILDEVEITKFI